jgi:hypothetical protein
MGPPEMQKPPRRLAAVVLIVDGFMSSLGVTPTVDQVGNILHERRVIPTETVGGISGIVVRIKTLHRMDEEMWRAGCSVCELSNLFGGRHVVLFPDNS